MSKRTKEILVNIIVMIITNVALCFMLFFNDKTRYIVFMLLSFLGSFFLGNLMQKLCEKITNHF